MSAPPSGSSGSSSPASPAPGYYPDPSIPNYIRYWNGSAWVPGTSRPAPEGVRTTPAQPAVQQQPADESGPMFLDADPEAPAAVQGVPETPAPAPAVQGVPETPAPAPAVEAPPAWPAPAEAGSELPPISWGSPPEAGEPPTPYQQPRVTPQPAPPEAPSWTQPAPYGRPPVPAPVPAQPAPWAEQVHELAREGVTPWRPVADDPFGSARAPDRPGGLLRRFAARMVDTVVFAAVTGAAALPLGSAAYHHAKDKVDAAKLTGETVKVWLLDATTGAELGAVAVVALLAGVLLEVLPTARWGRTLGKKLAGLKVLDIEAQQPPGFGASLRRWLVRSVLNVLVVGAVGVAWCLFDRPWRQGWHDKAARTFVAAA